MVFYMIGIITVVAVCHRISYYKIPSMHNIVIFTFFFMVKFKLVFLYFLTVFMS